MTVRQEKAQISLGIRPVWSESSQCAQWVAKDPNLLHADSEDSYQAERMPRLIWVFAGRTCHFVGFFMRRLNFWRKLKCYKFGKSFLSWPSTEGYQSTATFFMPALQGLICSLVLLKQDALFPFRPQNRMSSISIVFYGPPNCLWASVPLKFMSLFSYSPETNFFSFFHPNLSVFSSPGTTLHP